MTKVFCVFRGTYEDEYLSGVYSTFEIASTKSHEGQHSPQWSNDHDDWACEWRLTHHVAKVPITTTLETITVPVIDGVATLPSGRTIASESEYVVVPIPPPVETIRNLRSWDIACDVRIEAREVI